jgi:hypothetical protein
MRLRNWKSWSICFLMALLLAFLLNFLTQFIPEIGAWYSPSSTLRYQTDAFLRGHIALGFSPYGVIWDCVWDHGVQEVWGLGVPAFRFIFELPARLFGERFPDRITFLIACSLCYCFLLHTFAKCQDIADSGAGLASIWKTLRIACVLTILIFAPPFVLLLRTRFEVYEEVVAYGYLYSLVLFAGLLRVAAKTKSPGLLSLSLWAGVGVWIRPTLLFYGIATLILALGIGWRARVSRRTLVGMLSLFCLSGALLGYTNWSRFGAWNEFGHQLNVDEIFENDFALKFDYPFHHEPFLSAASDEMGTLFFVRELNGFDWYKLGILWGQSSTYRWREMYFTTYDVVYLCLLIASFLLWLRYSKRFREMWKSVSGQQPALEPEGRRVACGYALFAVPWGAISFMCLFGFYLWSPSMASRYNVDFLAAIMVSISALVWNLFELNLKGVRIGGVVFFMLTTLWLAFGITHSKLLGAFEQGRPLYAAQVKMQMVGSELPGLPEPLRHYQLGQPELLRGIPFNCAGWDLETGAVRPAVILFASDPQCVVVSLSILPERNITPEDLAPVQAKIGLEYLARESVTVSANKAVLVFRGPRRPRYQKGVQVCFLGFSRPEDLCREEPVLRLSDVSFERGNSGPGDSGSLPKHNMQ